MDDHVFHSKIHDPFALEELQKHTYLTLIQKDEFRWASGHCSYAAEGDYPWGTVKDEAGREHVVCRCLNTQCYRFTVCRPDFDPSELTIHEENKKAQPAIFAFEAAAKRRREAEDGDVGAAAKLFTGEKKDHSRNDNVGTQLPVEKKPDLDDSFVVKKPVPPTPKPVEVKRVDFGSFLETTQDEIIEAKPVERSIVNAGPGTGKTWTLIEKIIHMINEEQAAAENILVLCFSRSAVEVVRSRFADADEAGRIGYEWQDVDVRTFDSFCTYMLAWVQDNHKELLPRHFLLEAYDYDQRIKTATSIFRQKKICLRIMNTSLSMKFRIWSVVVQSWSLQCSKACLKLVVLQFWEIRARRCMTIWRRMILRLCPPSNSISPYSKASRMPITMRLPRIIVKAMLLGS